MSLVYNRYQGRWSPSGCLTVDAPNMVTAIKMLTKNKGSEPIHVLLLEEGIYVANALPQGSFVVSVLGIDPLGVPNTGNSGTNATNIGWKLGNSSVLTPYSIDGESVIESTPSGSINSNQDVVGTVYPMSGTLPLGNTVILNAVPAITGAYLFDHFTVSNPNVNGGSEEIYSLANGKVSKVTDGDYISYAIQFNIADGLTNIKAIFYKNLDYIDPETIIKYHINYYDISKDTEGEDEVSSPFIGYKVAESKYNTELVYNRSTGPIELINPIDNGKIDNYTIVGEGSAGLRISNVKIDPKVLTDTEENAYTSEETAPIKVSLEKYTEVTFQYNEYNEVENKVINKDKVSKVLKCGSAIDISTSMDAPVGTWYREVEGTDEATGVPITTYEVITFNDWKVPYDDITLYGPYDPSFNEPMIDYRVYYMTEYIDGNYHEYGYLDKSMRYGSNPELDTEGRLTINAFSSIPEAKINLNISPSEDNVDTNWVFNKTEGEDIVLTETTPEYYINSENAPKVYLDSYTKITFIYNDDRVPVSKWLRYNSHFDASTLAEILGDDEWWCLAKNEGEDKDTYEFKPQKIDDITEWSIPYAEHEELYNYDFTDEFMNGGGT